MRTTTIDARQLDEIHFGLVWLPDAARASAAWQEWCDMVRTLEDEANEFDVTDDDLPAVVEVYAALRRLGAVFHRPLARRMDAYHAAMLTGESDVLVDDDDQDDPDEDGDDHNGEARFPEGLPHRPATSVSLLPVALVKPMSQARAARLAAARDKRPVSRLIDQREASPPTRLARQHRTHRLYALPKGPEVRP